MLLTCTLCVQGTARAPASAQVRCARREPPSWGYWLQQCRLQHCHAWHSVLARKILRFICAPSCLLMHPVCHLSATGTGIDCCTHQHTDCDCVVPEGFVATLAAECDGPPCCVQQLCCDGKCITPDDQNCAGCADEPVRAEHGGCRLLVCGAVQVALLLACLVRWHNFGNSQMERHKQCVVTPNVLPPSGCRMGRARQGRNARGTRVWRRHVECRAHLLVGCTPGCCTPSSHSPRGSCPLARSTLTYISAQIASSSSCLQQAHFLRAPRRSSCPVVPPTSPPCLAQQPQHNLFCLSPTPWPSPSPHLYAMLTSAMVHPPQTVHAPPPPGPTVG